MSAPSSSSTVCPPAAVAHDQTATGRSTHDVKDRRAAEDDEDRTTRGDEEVIQAILHHNRHDATYDGGAPHHSATDKAQAATSAEKEPEDQEEDYMSAAVLAPLLAAEHRSISRRARGGRRPARTPGGRAPAASSPGSSSRAESHGAPPLKKRAVLEAEARARGLAQPLAASGLGFRMLQKCGYVAGEGVGKHGQGQAVPLPLAIKTGAFAFITSQRTNM